MGCLCLFRPCPCTTNPERNGAPGGLTSLSLCSCWVHCSIRVSGINARGGGGGGMHSGLIVTSFSNQNRLTC